MIVTRKSKFSGKTNSMDLPVTLAQVEEWMAGTPVQDAMPHLNADQREFIISGCTPEEWDAMFGDP